MTDVATTTWNMRKYEFSPTRILPYKDKIYDISENPYSRVFHPVNIQKMTIFNFSVYSYLEIIIKYLNEGQFL